MNRHDLWFLQIATLSLIIGVFLGIYMGISHDFTLTPVHAHVNLLGWASLALFGLAYRCYPELARGKSADVHLVLCGLAGLFMPAGIALAVLSDKPILAIVASLMWLAGSLTFLGKVYVLAAKARNDMTKSR